MPPVSALVTVALLAAPVVTTAAAQTRPNPTVDPPATAAGVRPIPGPVYESAPFSRAVARGTRTRTGAPGPRYWVQYPRYTIQATLDPVRNRLTGSETVVYPNHSPDSLRVIAVYLRQNVFAPGVPRRDRVPITGGVTLGRVAVNGRPLTPGAAAQPDRPPEPGQFAVDGTVMWIALSRPLLPRDSLRLDVAWSYTPAPAPADGRGRRGSRTPASSPQSKPEPGGSAGR